MKISVSLAQEKVDFVDDYTAQDAGRSRSSAIAEAIDLLQERELADAYAAAFTERSGSEDATFWESTSADGLEPGDAPESAVTEQRRNA